jgi:hypothetical protein
LDNLEDKSPSEWLADAIDTYQERGLSWGDPRDNFLRIYEIAGNLGVQLRDPADVAVIFIAAKLSRLVENPSSEDSYIDLVAYSAILATLRHTDWGNFVVDTQHE